MKSFPHGRWIAAIFLLLSNGFAQGADFCSRNKEQILHALAQTENRIAFENNGGLINGGVCWWHSRLQRSSVYLTRYAPDKTKPTTEEAVKLVRALTFMKSVVEIPGYSNFNDFTRDYRSVVQRELDHWQMRDGFINQQWIRGISGHWQVPAAELRARMGAIHEAFIDSPAGIWTMIQMKGIVSHAMLIIGIERTGTGYRLAVIDSNRPVETRIIDYTFGDTSLFFGTTGFVPYLGFKKDFVKIDAALTEYCRP